MSPFWRRALIVAGSLGGVAILGLLAFNTYAILSEDDGGPGPGPVSSSPQAQGTPACPSQQVYMSARGRCVPGYLSCAPSESWDRLRQRCVADIPEPVEPAEPAAPSHEAEWCQREQADLSDALADLAVKQAKFSQCQSPDPPAIGCMFADNDVDSALCKVESARSGVRSWCR